MSKQLSNEIAKNLDSDFGREVIGKTPIGELSERNALLVKAILHHSRWVVSNVTTLHVGSDVADLLAIPDVVMTIAVFSTLHTEKKFSIAYPAAMKRYFH